MSVESAKAKLDAQPGDPATGYISKADHQDSYTELVDDTALTGATTAEALTISGNLNGRDPDNLVAGPASATDNALVRFDGTGGKTVQGSGITVDDSNNISGLGTVAGTGLAGSLLSSASPVMDGVASAGTAVVPSRQDHVHPTDTTKVTGPASATDNALVRFDGTGGKAVQNSGITVDDSNNITSDLTISKAAATVRLTSASGAAYLACSRVAGQIGGLRLETGGALRWLFAVNNASESGSNAGSDFVLGNYTDAGTSIGNVLSVQRSTGKFQLVNVGASAGLELGTSGPRIMSGTGSPEGVVTAPVGSIWTDTAATTGAIKWVKATGTGNTGWVVEYGDTGRRAVASAVQTNYAVASSVNYLSRIGATVFYQGIIQKTTGNYAANDIPFILPAGFRPQSSFYQYAAGLNTGVQTNINIPSATGEVTLAANTAAAYLYLNLTFRTGDAWPTSLPGSAA